VLPGARYKEKTAHGVELDLELPHTETVKQILYVRKFHAHGYQQDYFSDSNLVGWTRHGNAEAGDVGCAVLVSSGGDALKRMNMGVHNRDKVMIDIRGKVPTPVYLDEKGEGMFRAKGASVSIWIEKT
jgi:alpha-amylase